MIVSLVLPFLPGLSEPLLTYLSANTALEDPDSGVKNSVSTLVPYLLDTPASALYPFVITPPGTTAGLNSDSA